MTVCNEYREPVAAITVMAPLTRMPEEMFSELGKRCLKAARQVENKLQE